jgi:hypothetical protein
MFTYHHYSCQFLIRFLLFDKLKNNLQNFIELNYIKIDMLLKKVITLLFITIFF